LKFLLKDFLRLYLLLKSYNEFQNSILVEVFFLSIFLKSVMRVSLILMQILFFLGVVSETLPSNRHLNWGRVFLKISVKETFRNLFKLKPEEKLI